MPQKLTNPSPVTRPKLHLKLSLSLDPNIIPRTHLRTINTLNQMPLRIKNISKYTTHFHNIPLHFNSSMWIKPRGKYMKVLALINNSIGSPPRQSSPINVFSNLRPLSSTLRPLISHIFLKFPKHQRIQIQVQRPNNIRLSNNLYKYI
jgi:hypothetical protein